MDGDGRLSEVHLSHTRLRLGVGPDSGGAEEEMDGWVFSFYCTLCTTDGAASLRPHYL